MKGGGGVFHAERARVDLAIVDAHFPEITCWEVGTMTVWVPTREDSLEAPVLGWDLLGLFRTSLDPRRRLIELRLLP